ncbi:hypothetical protein IKS73_02470 [bacterium]|nr:hypothetical protein [bacterium]
MRLTYSGKGYCVASPYSNGGKWDVWDIKVVDDASSASKATLTIRPLDKHPDDFCLKIRSLSSPALRSLKITFPPGANGIGYLKDLYVGSGMQSITVSGGDLGSNEGGDGLISINGSLGQLKLSGLKHKESGKVTYWGGNLWADVKIKGDLGSCLITGGNYSFLPKLENQRLACFNVAGSVKKFSLKAYLLKDGAGLVSSFGGFASADLTATESLNSLVVSGGGWYNGLIKSPKIKSVKFSGPSSKASALPMPKEAYGLMNASIRTISETNSDNFTSYNLGSCSFRSANVKNSLISSNGHLKGLKVSADKSGSGGLISNSSVYAGIGYDCNFIPTPVIYAKAPHNGILPAGTNCVFTLPFSITNLPAESVSYISISSRGLAWDCFISNEFNETFSNFDSWSVNGTNSVSGVFVWDPALGDFDFSGISFITLTNIKIRVAYGSAPVRHRELSLKLEVMQQAREVAMTNFIFSGFSNTPLRKAFPGKFSSLKCQSAVNSLFAGGVLFSSDDTSEHATYLGCLNSFKTIGETYGNRLYSKKKIKLNKDFDYEKNEVWIGGSRVKSN